MQNKAVIIIIALYTGLHIPYFFMPISGGHRWRQYDTAAVARNYVTESFDFFKPRIDVREEKTGIAGMEFPAYNYFISLIYRITGHIWVGFGKIVSFVFSLMSFGMLYKILKLEINFQDLKKTKFLLLLSSAFLSPFIYSYSSRFIPEFMALFCVLTGYYYFLKYCNNQNKLTSALICWLSLALGFLIRPYYSFFGLPLLSFFLFGGKINYKNRLLVPILGILILIPLILWYFVYVPYLNQKYGLNFFMGTPVRENLSAYLHAEMWIGMIKKLSDNFMGYYLVPFFVYGVYKLKQDKIIGLAKGLFIKPISQLFTIALCTVLVLPVIIGKHFIVHPYFLGGIIPAIVAGTFYGFLKLWEIYKKNIWVVLILFALVLLANQFHTYRVDKDIIQIEQIKSEIQTRTSIHDLFVVDGGNSKDPAYLYILNRKGWSVPMEGWSSQDITAKLEPYKLLGAKYVVYKSRDEKIPVKINFLAL
jgi:4-amino-4-deoxy-L-arabinose transferase-like glycosyltransferase